MVVSRIVPVFGAVCVALLAFGGWLVADRIWQAPALVEVVTAVRPDVVPGATATASTTEPRFDVVRVAPDGRAVVAGRAEPGAEVVVRDGEAEIARVRAGSDGTFVAVPREHLAPGGRELTLSARGAVGGEKNSDGSVVLVVPKQADVGPGAGSAGRGPVEAVLVPGAEAPRLVQGGRADTVPRGGLSLDVVDYDDKGLIRFTGGAAVGGALRLYVDNGAVGDARADGQGRWTLSPEGAVAAGVHSLRVDELDAAGRVMARVELPFQRATVSAAAIASAGGRVVVQPGESLWRMARTVYGQGIRYRVIYLANREQIRDPRRIYPGQTFAVPVVRGH